MSLSIHASCKLTLTLDHTWQYISLVFQNYIYKTWFEQCQVDGSISSRCCSYIFGTAPNTSFITCATIIVVFHSFLVLLARLRYLLWDTYWYFHIILYPPCGLLEQENPLYAIFSCLRLPDPIFMPGLGDELLLLLLLLPLFSSFLFFYLHRNVQLVLPYIPNVWSIQATHSSYYIQILLSAFFLFIYQPFLRSHYIFDFC